jgi:hypothetical protein
MEDSREVVQEKNERLNLAVARLTTQLDDLRSALADSKADLEYVEKQFISLERRLQSHETKASAVAALAEAKLACDKFARDNPALKRTRPVLQAKQKLHQSDRLLHENRYAAAVYFAKRSMRLLEEKEDARSIRIVSVNRANMRKGPGMEFDVVGQVTFGMVIA